MICRKPSPVSRARWRRARRNAINRHIRLIDRLIRALWVPLRRGARQHLIDAQFARRRPGFASSASRFRTYCRRRVVPLVRIGDVVTGRDARRRCPACVAKARREPVD